MKKHRDLRRREIAAPPMLTQASVELAAHRTDLGSECGSSFEFRRRCCIDHQIRVAHRQVICKGELQKYFLCVPTAGWYRRESALPDAKTSSGLLIAADRRPTLQFNSGQGTIGFDDTGGSGPLVIAVPGMGDLRSGYRYLTPYLTAAGYRVVTMDVRGHGASSSQWDKYSAHAIGQDVLALTAHLGQSRAILIGNSFSAGAALWAAHDAPEKVSQVVMIGPLLRHPPGGIPWYIQAVLSLGLGGRGVSGSG